MPEGQWVGLARLRCRWPVCVVEVGVKQPLTPIRTAEISWMINQLPSAPCLPNRGLPLELTKAGHGLRLFAS